jgi:hypothetical protein
MRFRLGFGFVALARLFRVRPATSRASLVRAQRLHDLHPVPDDVLGVHRREQRLRVHVLDALVRDWVAVRILAGDEHRPAFVKLRRRQREAFVHDAVSAHFPAPAQDLAQAFRGFLRAPRGGDRRAMILRDRHHRAVHHLVVRVRDGRRGVIRFQATQLSKHGGAVGVEALRLQREPGAHARGVRLVGIRGRPEQRAEHRPPRVSL